MSLKVFLRDHVHAGHYLFLCFFAAGLSDAEKVAGYLEAASAYFIREGEGLVLYSSTLILALCLLIMVSPAGKLRLGGADETPSYGFVAWFAMLFAAGMGTGLVFSGAAEPLLHYLHPPGEGDSLTARQGLRQAMVLTYLNWGLRAWGIYCIVGLAIAFFSFRHGRPMLISSPLGSLAGRSLPRWLRDGVDVFSVLAVVFGLVGTLGHGVLFIADGMGTRQADTKSPVSLMVLAVLCICYLASASTPISRGIKWLSAANLLVCLALLGFVMFFGPTLFGMEIALEAAGDYFSILPRQMADPYLFTSDHAWIRTWPVTYYMWWIAWSPFVGVFIARISRGRTIRQFLAGALVAPALLSFLWFGVMGASAFYYERQTGISGMEASLEDFPQVMYALLHQLPLPELTTGLTMMLVFLFLVTSADSGTYVLAMFTSRGNPTPPVADRLFWGGTMAVVTAWLLGTGKGLAMMRAFMVAAAIPYLLILMIFTVSLGICLWRETRASAAPPT